MTQPARPLAIPDVRVQLDTLITQVQLRADNLEVARLIEADDRRLAGLDTQYDHVLGRLHGLKEARELFDTLEAPAPRTIHSDLLEDR